ETDAGPLQKLVRLHLGWLDRWWWPFKLVLPFFAVAAFWMAINPFLVQCKIVPPCVSLLHSAEKAATIALGAYLSWQYVIYALLLLYIFSSYIYLGDHPFWIFVTATARNLLYPVRFLRIGKLDFAPVLTIVATFFLAQLAQRELTSLYSRLPI